MKKLKLLLVAILVVGIFTLTGCEPKREELKFEGKEGKITFNVKADKKYKISTNKDDFRTSREQGMLIGDGFKIGIEFDDDFDYFFKSDWSKLKEKRKENEDYKEVTYSDLKGIQYFYGGYMCYDVVLPVKNNKKYLLILTVYGDKDNEEAAKKAIKNEEVLDILNNITEIAATK